MADRTKARAMYDVNVQLTKSAKSFLNKVPTEKLESTLAAYLRLMNPEDVEENPTMEIDKQILEQMSLFASQSVSRLLIDRYRRGI